MSTPHNSPSKKLKISPEKINGGDIINYIYLLKEREFIKTNENIYKIGKTKQINLSRFAQYPNGSCLYFQMICSNCDKIEKNLINKFKSQSTFVYRSDIGYEYFQGDYKEMIQLIYSTIFSFDFKEIKEKKNEQQQPERQQRQQRQEPEEPEQNEEECNRSLMNDYDDKKIPLNLKQENEETNYLYDFTKSYKITNNPLDYIDMKEINEWINSKNINIYVFDFEKEMNKYSLINNYSNIVFFDNKLYGITKNNSNIYNFNQFMYIPKNHINNH
jgi:hypothetical protein